MIDISTLTLGEVAKIEDLSGLPISAIGDEDKPKGNALAALALVLKRRDGDPGFTWNQAQALTFDEVQTLMGTNTTAEDAEDAEDDDPKDN